MEDEPPKFKPDTWVVYKSGNAFYFGKIKGGLVLSGIWNYVIIDSYHDDSHQTVPEQNIYYLHDGVDWKSKHA